MGRTRRPERVPVTGNGTRGTPAKAVFKKCEAGSRKTSNNDISVDSSYASQVQGNCSGQVQWELA